MRKLASSLCFALVPALVAVLGVAAGGTQHPPPTQQGDPNPVVFAPGRLVPIGGGRSLYLKCEGHGRPEVILVGAATDGWIEVQDTVARTTHTCAYDRAGLGYSLPAPGMPSAAADIADLERLLHHAGLPAPYVLVGAAYGRLLAGLYAHLHPSETRGVVLVGAPAQPRGRPPEVAISVARPDAVEAAVLAVTRARR